MIKQTPEEIAADARQNELEATLRPQLTPQFLATLVLAMRTVGWAVDMVEIKRFVDHCHYIADVEPPPHGEPLL